MRTLPLALAALFTLSAGCASAPNLDPVPVGLAGVELMLPPPPGMIGVAADNSSLAPRNAELKAGEMRALRHFLVPDDAARAKNGLPLNHSLNAYVAVNLELQHLRVGPELFEDIRQRVAEGVAEFVPIQVEPTPEQAEAWDTHVIGDVQTESLDLRVESYTLSTDGPDHVCTYEITHQVSLYQHGNNPYSRRHTNQRWAWERCIVRVRDRLVHLMLSDHAKKDTDRRLQQLMTAWIETIRQANGGSPSGDVAPVEFISHRQDGHPRLAIEG